MLAAGARCACGHCAALLYMPTGSANERQQHRMYGPGANSRGTTRGGDSSGCSSDQSTRAVKREVLRCQNTREHSKTAYERDSTFLSWRQGRVCNMTVFGRPCFANRSPRTPFSCQRKRQATWLKAAAAATGQNGSSPQAVHGLAVADRLHTSELGASRASNIPQVRCEFCRRQHGQGAPGVRLMRCSSACAGRPGCCSRRATLRTMSTPEESRI